MTAGVRLDLVVLLPGKDEEEMLHGLLEKRVKSLEIRPLRYDCIGSPQRDAGCYKDAEALLRPYLSRAAHALVMFDHFGSGKEDRRPEELERTLEGRLTQSGWEERAAAVVFRPELESWVWTQSPHVDDVLGWQGREPDLRSWLRELSLWPPGSPKPRKPKACMKAALREARIPHSPRLFRALAERVTITGCNDPAFARFVGMMRNWFPASS